MVLDKVQAPCWELEWLSVDRVEQRGGPKDFVNAERNVRVVLVPLHVEKARRAMLFAA